MMIVRFISHFQQQQFTCCVSSTTVPLITSSDITINEDEGSATVTVQLQNEIEKEFVLNYNTGEVPDGADGMYV